tara:strand:+ start:199 stop:705 length:507 start_codon:yes stop_codon:yes gene_type:complete
MIKRKKNKGFTLIELLVVVAIIGILASVGVVAYNGYTESAKKGASKSNHNSVKKWIQNELQKCSIDEAKAMPNADGTKKLDCDDDGDPAAIIKAVSESIGTAEDFKNPWSTDNNAVKASAGPGSGSCGKDHRGYSYLTNSGGKINIFTCTMQKDGDDKNEVETNVSTN